MHTVNHWGLLLCLPQTEKNEEKTRREPRDEAEQLHAEVKHNARFSEQLNLNWAWFKLAGCLSSVRYVDVRNTCRKGPR